MGEQKHQYRICIRVEDDFGGSDNGHKYERVLPAMDSREAAIGGAEVLTQMFNRYVKDRNIPVTEAKLEPAGFVKFSCGFIGLRIPGTGDIVIHDCRADYDEDLTFMLRPEGLDKEAIPMAPAEVAGFCDKVRDRILEGGAYRDLALDLSMLLRTVRGDHVG